MAGNTPEPSKRKGGVLKLLVSFIWTGDGYEDKQKLYIALGATTLALAAIFGLVLLIEGLLMVLKRVP